MKKNVYNFPFWENRENFKKALYDQIKLYNFNEDVKALVNKAIYDKSWIPALQYDGCSFIQDTHHPCLWCYVHDYLWKTGQGGIESDKIMKFMALTMKRPKKVVYLFYWGVRIGWLFYFKYKHLLNKNVNPLCKEAKILIKNYNL